MIPEMDPLMVLEVAAWLPDRVDVRRLGLPLQQEVCCAKNAPPLR